MLILPPLKMCLQGTPVCRSTLRCNKIRLDTGCLLWQTIRQDSTCRRLCCMVACPRRRQRRKIQLGTSPPLLNCRKKTRLHNTSPELPCSLSTPRLPSSQCSRSGTFLPRSLARTSRTPQILCLSCTSLEDMSHIFPANCLRIRCDSRRQRSLGNLGMFLRSFHHSQHDIFQTDKVERLDKACKVLLQMFFCTYRTDRPRRFLLSCLHIRHGFHPAGRLHKSHRYLARPVHIHFESARLGSCTPCTPPTPSKSYRYPASRLRRFHLSLRKRKRYPASRLPGMCRHGGPRS